MAISISQEEFELELAEDARRIRRGPMRADRAVMS
jgi:hypothetical protein